MKQFGWLYTVLTHIPEWLVGIFHPLSKQLFELRRSIAKAIDDAKRKKKVEPMLESGHRPNAPVFAALLTSSKQPLSAPELSTSRLTDEGLTFLGAGTVTTAQTLSNTMYYVLADPKILSTLQSELAESSAPSASEPTSWSALSQLPYLTAVLTEGLRLSYGVSHRLPRISPDRALHLGDHTIPPGTPVSMTQMLLHDDPTLFPDPLAFRPERWLCDPDADPAALAALARARRFFVPFSRGTRACLGTNLAWAELYLCLAGLLGRRPGQGGLEMRLWETGIEDVRVEHDYFNPAPRRTSLGVRVLVS
jgi:cytochrome P450